MKLLRKRGNRKTFAFMVGAEDCNSTIYVPANFDPEEIIACPVTDSTSCGVPINHIMLSLIKWLELTERFYEQLIKANQPELARQILPRGGR